MCTLQVYQLFGNSIWVVACVDAITRCKCIEEASTNRVRTRKHNSSTHVHLRTSSTSVCVAQSTSNLVLLRAFESSPAYAERDFSLLDNESPMLIRYLSDQKSCSSTPPNKGC